MSVRIKVPQREGPITIYSAGQKPRTFVVSDSHVTARDQAEAAFVLGAVTGAEQVTDSKTKGGS